jgi:Lon protease-like protein
MPTSRIPLFPLNLVLFPGTRLPLHIFEERYKLMIGRCIQQQSPFGVILAVRDGIATIGCTAQVLQVAETYEDGRMDIITTGQSAYRIQELHNDQPYLEGDVEMLDDDLRPGSDAETKQLRAIFDKCYRLLHNAAPEVEEEADVPLSYQIAAELPLDLEVRQAVLETRVEADRRTLLIERLTQVLPQLERIHAARSKVSGNGHAVN